MKRSLMCSWLAAASLAAWGSTALAQYESDYEDLVADADGEILTDQDNYYLPVTGSVDFLAFTYDGNTLGLPQNPQGGDQFVAGIGPANSTYCRAQRDLTWGDGVWVVTYDVCCAYDGDPPGGNNLGSFSLQPYPGSQSYLHLFSWPDLNDPTYWQAFYLAYNADGTAHTQPGMSPGPEWENLELKHWYHFATWIDFDINQIVQVSITDLNDCTTGIYNPTDWYLEGGSGGGQPDPTGFRWFAGSATIPGNTVAADNIAIYPVDALVQDSLPFEGVVCGMGCPGQTKIDFWGMTPGGRVAIVASSRAGQFQNPNPPCQGITIDMRTPFLKGFPLLKTADAQGRVSVQGKVAGPLCGKVFVQAVDLSTCRVTKLRTVW